MQLKEIKFSPNEEGDVMPSTINVTMTIEEALWIAKVAGQQRGESPHSGIYDCLTGDVFNRYWDDGLDDASKEIRIETPVIKYE